MALEHEGDFAAVEGGEPRGGRMRRKAAASALDELGEGAGEVEVAGVNLPEEGAHARRVAAAGVEEVYLTGDDGEIEFSEPPAPTSLSAPPVVGYLMVGLLYLDRVQR